MNVLHLQFGQAVASIGAVLHLSDGEILRLFSLHVICMQPILMLFFLLVSNIE